MRKKSENDPNPEAILDLEEVPFISRSMLTKTVVDKVKMNEDHSLVAFTLDIGFTETLTGGVKDMNSGKVLDLKFDDIIQMEFGAGKNIIYFTEADDENRPCVVKKMKLDTQE
eukprot:CAMPEP_0116871130 /NCGR_PEP_ID=MMETSP0463-20121206/1347_1 /TAXON_ID=181622 /ORGANISM="Strombidinopsis sp, Strain SopsisLIS2011" /LENGTH=112 /DNA_ID=CAMNT_0004508977 /DNA_START=375 /DNA_END=713 /DNA_ORIENTATION=+